MADKQPTTLVQKTYIVAHLIFCLAMVGLAVAAPIWLTPGIYWWTAFALFMFFGQSYAFTERLNSWGTVGHATNCSDLHWKRHAR